MADSNVWRFEQLEDPFKTLTLAGSAAPYGRPRQKPVLTDKLMVRQQVVRYPDNASLPTRHIFGSHRENWEITGRWMDRRLGDGAVADLVDAWESFVRDKRRVSVAWGATVAYTGVIESFQVAWESPTEVVWTLLLSVDEKDGDQVPRASHLIDHATQVDIIIGEIQNAATQKLKSDPGWHPDILDSIDTLVSAVSVATSAVYQIAHSFSNLEAATFQELNRFRAGLNQLRTAIITMEDTLTAAKVDTYTLSRESKSDIAWYNFLTSNSINNYAILADIADLMRASDLAARGKNFTTYTAATGDTWERISTIEYGIPDYADKIRQANAVRYGVLPIAGTKYKIPQA
jgi:hypothetical protein